MLWAQPSGSVAAGAGEDQLLGLGGPGEGAGGGLECDVTHKLVHSSVPTWGALGRGPGLGCGLLSQAPKGMSASCVCPCLGPPTLLERLALPVQTGGVPGPTAFPARVSLEPRLTLDNGPACLVVPLASGQRAGGAPQGPEASVSPPPRRAHH